jgi:hypothetical protein
MHKVDEGAGPAEGEGRGKPGGTRFRNKTPSSGSACSSCEDSSDQGESDGAEAAIARTKSSAGKFAAHCGIVLTASCF